MSAISDTPLNTLALDVSRPSGDKNELRVPYTKYLRSLYLDLLGRPPSEAVVEDWVNQFMAGTPFRTAVNVILESTEYRERVIHESYDKFLGRTPTAEGMGFWGGLLATRAIEEVFAAMVSSSEYFNRNGASNDRYVRALFADVIGRRNVDVEADAWIAILNSHSASRLCVAYDFFTCDEYRALQLKQWYARFLRREPSQDAMTRSLNLMQNGATQDQMISGLLASREYFMRVLAGG